MRPEQHHPLAALVVAALLAGCGVRPCHPEVDPGATYRVTIIERYDPASHFTFDSALTRMNPVSSGPCAGDGIVAGATFELRGAGRVDNASKSCAFVKAEPASLPPEIADLAPSTGTDVPLAQGSDSLIFTDNQATIGGCTGQLVFNLFAGGGPGGMFGAPMEGQRPPVVLYRLFSPETGTCQVCDDNFVAQLVKS
jgi:hypothetical protein